VAQAASIAVLLPAAAAGPAVAAGDAEPAAGAPDGASVATAEPSSPPSDAAAPAPAPPESSAASGDPSLSGSDDAHPAPAAAAPVQAAPEAQAPGETQAQPHAPAETHAQEPQPAPAPQPHQAAPASAPAPAADATPHAATGSQGDPDSGPSVTTVPVATAQNVSTVYQAVWQVQKGCQSYCYGTTQTQSATQSSTTTQSSVAAGAASTPSGAESINVATTIQFVMQQQLGCVAFCFGTSQTQSASQHASTTQTATATAEAIATAINVAETFQFVWQQQVGCAAECHGASTSQSVDQQATTEGSDTTASGTPFDTPGAFLAWLALLAANASAQIETIYQEDEASCLDHCAGDAQVQEAVQTASITQEAAAAIKTPVAERPPAATPATQGQAVVAGPVLDMGPPPPTEDAPAPSAAASSAAAAPAVPIASVATLAISRRSPLVHAHPRRRPARHRQGRLRLLMYAAPGLVGAPAGRRYRPSDADGTRPAPALVGRPVSLRTPRRSGPLRLATSGHDTAWRAAALAAGIALLAALLVMPLRSRRRG
jgi:hypothetical protein